MRDLPTLPEVAAKVMEIANNPRSSAADMAKVISQDQALTAKILKLVNSAYYGFPRKISTITQAIVILGFRTVRDLVLNISISDMFNSKNVGGLNAESLWLHNLGVAITAKILAKRIGYDPPEEAFTCGLLHDLGKLVFIKLFPQEYEKVATIARDGDKWIRDVEEAIFEIDHSVVGKWVADYWKFPHQLVQAIQMHHQPNLDNEYPELTSIIHGADILTRIKKIGSGGDNQIPSFRKEAWMILKLKPQDLNDIYNEIEKDIEGALAFLHVLRGK
ncbi:MAG: HDOD domain-containing protein [Synergistetes bacterium]|nr:HDOD domain-containing protein [Synergistota bacterium]MDW8191443.1 HDOD domain-containing protein [Synergistota bacterium]